MLSENILKDPQTHLVLQYIICSQLKLFYLRAHKTHGLQGKSKITGCDNPLLSASVATLPLSVALKKQNGLQPVYGWRVLVSVMYCGRFVSWVIRGYYMLTASSGPSSVCSYSALKQLITWNGSSSSESKYAGNAIARMPCTHINGFLIVRQSLAWTNPA